MASKGVKKSTKKSAKVEVHSDDDVEQEIKQIEKEFSEEHIEAPVEKPIEKPVDKFETVEQDTPKAEKPQPKSVIEFDYDEIKNFDATHTKDIDDFTLMRILIVRGKEHHNPAMWAGIQRLLKQLNGEFEDTGRNDSRFRGHDQPQRYQPRFQRRDNYAPQSSQMAPRTDRGDGEVRPPQFQRRTDDFKPRSDDSFRPRTDDSFRGRPARRGGFNRRDEFDGNTR